MRINIKNKTYVPMAEMKIGVFTEKIAHKESSSVQRHPI